MTFQIITADQRLSEKRGIKGCIFGRWKIGKTSLLWTLDATKTLFIDLEAGDLAVEGWAGDTIRPRTWQECSDFAAYIGGPNPALRDNQPYSQAHYDYVCSQFGDASALDKYDTIFVDSKRSRHASVSNGAQDSPKPSAENRQARHARRLRATGREMMAWLTHLQHTRGKNIWFVGILDEKTG